MKISNIFYNWFFRVKRLRRKGCKNCGIITDKGKKIIVKFDWGKPFIYVSELYELANFPLQKKINEN